ncbi:MAG: aroE [Rhodospirillaceae bacterium]|nr:MAG: aroE [Rhodospirillaceae bacterium]
MILSGKALLAGVIGWPVEQSRSPRLHGWWLERYGINGAYVPLAVAPEHFAEVVRALGKAGFRGVNVTVPHKEAAFALADEVDSFACRTRAVNTLVYKEDGHLFGLNTDGFGFIENLRNSRPDWSAQTGSAVVLGSGGAARAIIAILLDNGAPEIFLTNRSRARAEALATDLDGPITVVNWSERTRVLKEVAMVVNTTILGMIGAPPLELDLSTLPKTALVADIVYTPRLTPLLVAAQAQGHPIIEGIGMLLHQARPGFTAWFGVEPEVTAEVRSFVLSGQEE